MKKPTRCLSVLLSFLGMIAAAPPAISQTWTLKWSDEFDGSRGTAPNPANWVYDLGAGGWGNQELETYCGPNRPNSPANPPPCDASQPNVFLDGDGHLVIRAVRLTSDPAPVGKWTSARIKSLGLREFQYGRMEACISLPTGPGIWPAFWMMGAKGGWPTGGEIDVMENIPLAGSDGHGMGPRQVQATIHGSTLELGKQAYGVGKRYTFPTGHGVNDEACHVYGVVRSPNMMQFYVDDWDNPYFIVTASDLKAGQAWPFEAPFYFLLNLAIGGNWPGLPDAQTQSPAEMRVDYVRVYRAAKQEAPVISAIMRGIAGGSGPSAVLEISAPAGTGFVYLRCDTSVPALTCSVDTGNAFSRAVVDLRDVNAASAKVFVTGKSTEAGVADITIVGETAGGEQVTVPIKLAVN